MTGEGSLHGSFGRFKIPSFPNQQHIGILTHKSPQGPGKVIALLPIHLGLGNPLEAIFNRIFDRGNVNCGTIAFREQGIQGCGFP